MGVTDAPAWILAAWRRSLRDLGATADRDTVDSYGERMIERWSAPERIHHNLKRLIAVLARVDELAPETHDPNMVRLAAWYHGAVFNAAAQHAYAHRGGIDEEASADLAQTELAQLGVPEDVVRRIVAMIKGSTRHAASKSDIDAQALCDADLGGLAVDPQRYAAYRKEVRQEYAHIPQSDYVRARLAIVSKLLGRPYLFQSPMAQAWEDPARENLTAELNRLTSEAAKLPTVDADAIESDARRRGAEGCTGAGGPGAVAGSATDSTGDATTTPRTASPQDDGARSATAEEDDGDQSATPGGVDGDQSAPPGGDEDARSEGWDVSEPPVRDFAPAARTPEAPAGQQPRRMASRERAQEDPARSVRSAGTPERPDSAARQARSAPTPAQDEGTQLPEGRKETLAERSQRRWEELHGVRAAGDDEGTRQARRRGVSAASPAEPGSGTSARSRSGEDARESEAEEIDKTSSLSRPPKMPAVKRRPREDQ